MVVLGVDPGSLHTGYAVLNVVQNRQTLVEYGTLHLHKLNDHQLRLKHLFERLSDVIDRHLPDECAVEMPVYGKNPQSMLKLGRAQATAMLAALVREIPVQEYTPKEIKKSVTGNGNASKEQVWFMVRAILKIEEAQPKDGLDASDALAIALCHAQRKKFDAGPSYTGWDAFLRANPDRAK